MKRALPSFGPLQKGELEPLLRVLGVSFALTPEAWATWVTRLGQENLRVLRKDGVIVGTVGAYRFGHFYRGKSVRAAGIAGVSVAPEHRAAGLAREMLVAALREEHEKKTPIATLFASTQYFCRSVGFEHIGQMIHYRAPVASLRPPKRFERIAIEQVEPSQKTFEPMYLRAARARPGHVDRNLAMWQRRLAAPPAGETLAAYVFGPPDAPEGYLVVASVRSDPRTFDLRVRDMVWLTPRAAAAILRFLHDQRSLVRDALWLGPANDPLQALIAEQTVKVEHSERVFGRVLDVKAALVARGYQGEGELTFSVDDPIFPENAGPWTLSVRRGRGRVKRAQKARAHLTINGLASLFSGFYDATQLVSVGAMTASARDVATANAIFAGPLPWISDMF